MTREVAPQVAVECVARGWDSGLGWVRYYDPATATAEVMWANGAKGTLTADELLFLDES